MRLFISVELSSEAKKQLADLQRDIKKIDLLKGTYVAPDTMHLTLKFLGDVEESKVKDLIEKLSAIKFRPFEFNLKGIGVYPSTNYVKVLWVGAEKGKDDIKNLHRFVEKAVEKAGFAKETREFSSHITLLRVRQTKGKAKLPDLFKKYEKKEFGNVKVDKFYLMRSKLMSNGATHEVVKEFSF